MKKKKAASRTAGEIGSVLKSHHAACIFLAVCMIFAVLFSLLPPQILRLVIDEKLSRGEETGLLALAVLYLAFSVLGLAAEFGKGWFLTILGEKYIHKIRSDLMAKLNRVSIVQFSRESDGAIAGRFVNDVDNVGTLVSDGIASLITDLFKIGGIIISILLFSWKMAVLVAVVVPLLFLLTRLFQKLTLKAQEKNLSQMGEMNAVLTDTTCMAKTIKLYHREKWMQDRYRRMLEDNYRTNASIYFFDASYSPLVQIIRAVVIALIAVMASGSPGLASVSISAGMAAASIDLITRLFDPINSLGMEFQNIQRGISGIRRIDEFLSLPEEPEKTRKLSQKEREGDVVFDHVSYAYPDGPMVIQDFSLTARRGDRTVIMGRTGAGKTTLIGLLTGLLVPKEGNVTIGGVPACEVSDSQKRQIFGYVQQDFWPVMGNMIDQVTMKDPAVTEDMALRAIGLTGLIDELQNLPDGLDTDIRAAALSQGQQMLLQIARAIAPGPDILIFDESTASLDALTEKRIDDALSKAAEDRIVFIISHRKTARKKEERVVRIG